MSKKPQTSNFVDLLPVGIDLFHMDTRTDRRRNGRNVTSRSFATVPKNYLLTPWCRVLLQELTGLQLVKKLPAFHGTRRFITALTSVRHLSLSWASPIQSIYTHPTSLRSILIVSAHLRLGLPSCLLPSGFPTKTLYTHLSSPIRATCPAHLILLDFITHVGVLAFEIEEKFLDQD